MKILIIHPEDPTTNFLKTCYSNIECTIISNNISKSLLRKTILAHDIIVMLGHGNEQGLLGFNRFIIDSTFVYLLREKVTVCIWCNSDRFVEKYTLFGFHTGMIISEDIEANIYNIICTQYDIDQSNYLFSKSVKDLLENRIDPLSLQRFKTTYSSTILNNPIVKFNENNIYYAICE